MSQNGIQTEDQEINKICALNHLLQSLHSHKNRWNLI